MLSTSSKDGDRYLLQVSGDLDIESAPDLKAALLEGTSSGLDIQLDMADATDLDVSCLQLLWSAHTAAKKNGRAFCVIGDLPPNLQNAVSDAGLAGSAGFMQVKAPQVVSLPESSGALTDDR